MKNIINYYYNLYPEVIKNRYGGFLFIVNNEKYLLTQVVGQAERIKYIYDLLIRVGIGNYIIVNNQSAEYYSTHNHHEYILFRIRCIAEETMMIKDTINIPAPGKSLWSNMWSERINYYERQINELGQDKKTILQTVNYYIGLAENAITIANNYEKELNTGDYALQHHRMHVPITKGDYFNPNNMLIDIRVRDAAEYVKSSFFNDAKTPDEYLYYLLSLSLDNKKANLLLARLLYPTYYFDLFDEIILGDRDEGELIGIINEVHKYERFLKAVYTQLSQRFHMINIEWLKT